MKGEEYRIKKTIEFQTKWNLKCKATTTQIIGLLVIVANACTCSLYTHIMHMSISRHIALLTLMYVQIYTQIGKLILNRKNTFDFIRCSSSVAARVTPLPPPSTTGAIV